MSSVSLHVLQDAEALFALRAEQLGSRLAANPQLVLLSEADTLAAGLFRAAATRELDLRSVRLRFAFAFVPTEGPDAAGRVTRFFENHVQQKLGARAPIDWVVLPESIATCAALETALAEQGDAWASPRHPESKSASSEIRIDATAEGLLARIRHSCDTFENLLAQHPVELASLSLGPAPAFGFAGSCGPWVDGQAGTHLARLDPGTRERHLGDFGGDVEAVPGYGLSVGPRVFREETEVWIHALGPVCAEAVHRWFALVLDADDAASRSPLAHAFRCQRVSIAMDTAAAEDLLDAEGRAGLQERFERAGHDFVLNEPGE